MIAEATIHEALIMGGIMFVRPVEISDLKRYMEIAFDGDNDLIDKYHFSDKTIEDTVENNIKNIEELAIQKEVLCYGVYLEDIPIGFTVISKNLLYSFGINKYCRSKEIVLAWLKWVKKSLNNNFVVCLHIENIRAINFFRRNGLEIFDEDGKTICLIT